MPSIVTKAIDYLDTKGVKMEGLFRISGAKARINEVIALTVCLFFESLECFHKWFRDSKDSFTQRADGLLTSRPLKCPRIPYP